MTDSEIFLTEALGSAIIDTACTCTVCGDMWLDSYMSHLSQAQVNKLLQSETPSSRPFRFGDGTVVYSSRKAKLPAQIGQTKCDIESEVVPVDNTVASHCNHPETCIMQPRLCNKMGLKGCGKILSRVVLLTSTILIGYFFQ